MPEICPTVHVALLLASSTFRESATTEATGLGPQVGGTKTVLVGLGVTVEEKVGVEVPAGAWVLLAEAVGDQVCVALGLLLGLNVRVWVEVSGGVKVYVGLLLCVAVAVGVAVGV